VVKTRLDLEAKLEAAVQKIHPYEVPCILRFEVRANEAYEDWIISETVAGVEGRG
jgi:periplasmic divalent cation tolerance protein